MHAFNSGTSLQVSKTLKLILNLKLQEKYIIINCFAGTICLAEPKL